MERWALFHAIVIGTLFEVFPLPAHAEDASNVTAAVAAAVKDNKLTINADNTTFGDTAPGVPKKLFVQYSIGDEKLKRDVNEGGTT